MDQRQESILNYAKVILQLVVGCAIYAISIDVFYSHAKLLGGGVTGIAQILHYQFGLSVSLMIIAINVPLFICGWIFVDRKFVIFSLLGMLLMSAFLKIFSSLSLDFETPLTAIVLGGIFNGLGLGIIYRSGASAGGTDIISKIIQKYRAGNMAYTGLIINTVVIAISAFINGIDEAVLTLCAMFISSRVNTFIIDGIDHRRAITIITSKPDEISSAINSKLGRGVTVLKGYGAYTHSDRAMLYSVIAKSQLSKMKQIVKSADPQAFFTITPVTGVYGHGSKFFSIQKDI